MSAIILQVLCLLAFGILSASTTNVTNSPDIGYFSQDSTESYDSHIQRRIRSLRDRGIILTVERATVATEPTIDQGLLKLSSSGTVLILVAVTDNVVLLCSTSGASRGTKYFRLLEQDEPTEHTQPLTNHADQVYLTPITVGGQSFLVVVDTGSADTWLASSDFKCTVKRSQVTTNSTTLPSNCNFGPLYTKSKTFISNPATTFSTTYSGEYLEGILGTETITLANLTLTGQPFSIATSGFWIGDGQSSGLLGLAFPSASALLEKTTPKLRPNDTTPVFTSLVRAKLIPPIFSIAITNVNEGPGILAFGGLPRNIKYEPRFVATPMELMTFATQIIPMAPPRAAPNTDFRMYRIRASAFGFGLIQLLMGAQVTLDTGTPHLVLPASIARPFNAMWTPMAQGGLLKSTWDVACNAKNSPLAVTIAGMTFEIPLKDLIIKEKNGRCTSAVTVSNSISTGLLGAPFFKTALVVFDVGKGEVRLAKRIRPQEKI